MSSWHIYILRCRGGSLYTGATNDLAGRVRVHTAGRGAKYTRSRLPVRLVYFEPAVSQSAALRREAEIKSWPRGRKIELIVQASRRRIRIGDADGDNSRRGVAQSRK